MVGAVDQFITRMKLRELRAQRDRSEVAYEELGRKAAAARDDGERIQVLYDGLRNLRFAKQPLHPDVANLEPVLRDIASGAASPETLAFWRARLEQELAQGRLRAEIVYIFGALLEEWIAENPADEQADAAQRQARAELLERATHETPAGDYGPLFASLFAATGLGSPELTKQTREAVRETVYARVQPDELKGVLRQICDDVYRSTDLRGQAQRFLFNSTLLKELADALTLQVDHLDEWDWPREGVPAEARWARTKWRLFLDEDLPAACLLDVLGNRWQRVLKQTLEKREAARFQHMEQLIERASLSSPYGYLSARGVDLWGDTRELAAEPSPDAPLDEQLKYLGEYGSIFEMRSGLQGRLHGFEHFDGYRDEGRQTGGMDTALTLINAEIELSRAAFPDRPFYVTKVDLKSYYPSIPHEVPLDLLSRLGLTGLELEFFRRYLRVRIADGDGGAPLTQQTGIPNHRHLSDLLGELLLRLLDLHVQRAAKVIVVRVVDDICLLAASAEEAVKAWRAVERFCAACGLGLNEEKCGAVCIGGDLPPELPAAAPGWLLLRLDADGQWSVDAPAFEAYLGQARERALRSRAILARVEGYNAAVRYLKQALALAAPLGEAHRRSVRDAMTRVHRVFFGDGTDVADAVRRLIRERYLGAGSAARLPEAWVYWPITAGGVGLAQAPMQAASYAEAYSKREKVSAPAERGADWQRRSNGWAGFYGELLGGIRPSDPSPNKVMETLVGDFIARGAELTEGRQTTLSAYWRWVLYIYGPQLLQSFGTFRFLFSELAPLQLLTQRGRLDTELIGGEADDIEF